MQSALAEQAKTFRENLGQWDSRARFLAQAPGLDYWVTGDGIKVDQYRTGIPKESYKPVSPDEPYDKVSMFEDVRREGHVVSMKFIGANPTTGTQGFGPRKSVVDYLSSAQHQARGVRTYSEAEITGIYSGVHARHYLKDDKIRYDIIVEPGHDPRQIELGFSGIDGLAIVGGTKVTVGTSMGSLNMADLKVYQPIGNAQKLVDARFVKTAKGTVRIELGSYDPRLPLVIDPTVFGSYVGSNGVVNPPQNANEVVTAITAESNGNLYMTGVTSTPTFPVNDGAYGKINVQGQDAFLCQMDGNAYTISYSCLLGGTGTDFGMGVGFAEDTRVVWVGGTTSSTDFAGANNAKGSGSRVWLSKFIFSNTGVQPQFSTYINDPGAVTAANFRTVKVSKAGVVYTIGNSTVTTLQGQGYTNYLPNNTVGAKKAGFVCAVDSTGNVVYRTMFGGKVDVVALNGAVTKSDELTVCGYVDAANTEDTAVNPDPSFTTTSGVFVGQTGLFSGGRLIQQRQAFVVRLKDDGTGLWSTLLGGADNEDARAVAYDTAENVYVTGFTRSFNMQRSPGAYQQDFSTPQPYVTKLSADASQIMYSTGLGSNGNIVPTCIAVDGRDNCYLGGIAGFTNNSPFPGIYVQSTPGSIYTTHRVAGDPEDACDSVYAGGDKSVDITNTGAPDSNVPSTTDGFTTVFNPAGSQLLYSSYVGVLSDDRINDVFVDSVGGAWFAGYSQVVWNNFVNSGPIPSTSNGIGIDQGAPATDTGHVTANAFKTSIPLGGPGAGQPNFGSSNGWVFKLRVVLPRLANLTINPTSAPGGFGATSTVTVFLQDPAPVGGVTVDLTLSNASATSWDPNSVVLTTPLVIPAGVNNASVTLYTLPVVSNQISSVKVILDNDFKENRITVLPWLSDMSVAPLVTQGGNNLTVNVNLSSIAPAGGVPVNLSTDRPDLILLPQPAEINVPQGAINAQAVIATTGVDQDTSVNISASFLGVTKTKTITLKPAKLKDFTFAPSRVNRGDDSTGTVRFFGKTGIARVVTISQVSGDTGVLVNGQALPVQINVPAQADHVDFTVTAPLTISQGFATLKADDGLTNVTGTLNIDPIDILDIVISPGTDVTAGTVLTGQVTLTRPAGPSGLTINLTSSNINAGTLSTNQVTVPAGQTQSSSFTFNTAIVPTDTITNIHATRPGFADKYRTVTVRGIKMTLSVSPSAVIGFQQNATGTITLTKPAPNGGLQIVLGSSDTTVASMSPTTIVVPAGDTTMNFVIFTKRTPVQRVVTISAVGSPFVKDSKPLTVNPPAITAFDVSPTSVLGGSQVKCTITLSTQAPAGTVVSLSASPSGIVTMPASVTITPGLKVYSFFVTTKALATTTVVALKATLAPTSKTANLIVRSPGVSGLTFNPTRVQGTKNSTGTVTLDGAAPTGGIAVTIASDDPTVADVIGSHTVTIPAGAFKVSFPVKTSKVSRTLAIKFTATSSAGVTTGFLYVDP